MRNSLSRLVCFVVGVASSLFDASRLADRRGDHVLPTGEALSDVAVARDASGALSFRFTQPLRASPGARGVNASTPLSAAGSTPLNWGLFPSWTLSAPGDHPKHDDMHTRWSHRPTLLNLGTGESAGGGNGFGRALTAHGARVTRGLMFTALLAPSNLDFVAGAQRCSWLWRGESASPARLRLRGT